MARRTVLALVLIPLVGLVLAGCGSGGPKHTGRTVTFGSAGAFPPSTIVGTYSARGCTHDANTVVENAHLYYVHSTGAPGPADLYYYDMRFAYAHFLADGCTSGELGEALKSGLTARQQAFLLRNVASNLHQAFLEALNSA
jgi:hypothetical protein